MGHDFRPDYLILSELHASFPGIPIAAFTATATERVQKDIIRILKLDDPYTVRASFNRRELDYQVQPKDKVLSQITGFVRSAAKNRGSSTA